MGLYGRSSHLEIMVNALGGIRNARYFPVEHLGLGSIQGYCDSRGLEVELVNGITEYHRTEQETFEAIRSKVGKAAPPVLIGFTGPNLVLEENLWLAAECKRAWPQCRVILGHDFATLNYARILQQYPDIDFVCRAEGELVFAKLAELLLLGNTAVSEFEKIPGLAWRAADRPPGQRVGSNPPEALDVDRLPWAKRGDLKTALDRGFGASISTSRGCPFRCHFCTTGQTAGLLGGKSSYRLRCLEGVLDEVEMLYKDYHVRHLVITDDLFLTSSESSRTRAEGFGRGLIERKLKISFKFDCRIDSIDLQLFKFLREAGLHEVFIGVETGSDEQRKKYNKDCGGSNDAKKALRGVLDLGVKIVAGIITFHPETSCQELKETLELLEALETNSIYNLLNRIKPYPGTPLYEHYRRNGWLSQEWPVAEFVFKNPRAELMFQDLLRSSGEPGMTFEILKQRFLAHLRSWDEVGDLPDGARR
jgi:radical SAM superfamily enzyme YgiQ (UPF0313 family)